MRPFNFLYLHFKSLMSIKALYIISLVAIIVTEGVGQSITINGGTQNLMITTGIAGGQLSSVTNTSATLTYVTPLLPWRNWKITVGTLCLDQNFNLSVVATSVTRGQPQAR